MRMPEQEGFQAYPSTPYEYCSSLARIAQLQFEDLYEIGPNLSTLKESTTQNTLLQ